jgi:hypothetical protein
MRKNASWPDLPVKNMKPDVTNVDRRKNKTNCEDIANELFAHDAEKPTKKPFLIP